MCRSDTVERDGKTWQIREIRPEETTVVKENRDKASDNIPAGYALLSDGTLLRLFPLRYYTKYNRLGW